MTSLHSTKQALRRSMRRERLLLAEHERMAMSAVIVDRVVALPEIQQARAVHCYLSIAALGEVATEMLLTKLHSMGKQLMVPVVESDGLRSVCYYPSMPLQKGEFGQPEPVERVVADESQLDAVIVPLVAFDTKGQRLGYGKGYYDRFFNHLLKQHRAPQRIGLAFLMQHVATLPAELWDQPLDMVVHEKGVLRFSGSVGREIV